MYTELCCKSSLFIRSGREHITFPPGRTPQNGKFNAKAAITSSNQISRQRFANASKSREQFRDLLVDQTQPPGRLYCRLVQEDISDLRRANKIQELASYTDPSRED